MSEKTRKAAWSSHQAGISEKASQRNFLYLAVTNRGQRKFKHFTTASEIKSYQEHPQKHKPQEMITQYACNKPACFMTSKCKTWCSKNEIYSKFRMPHALCSASNRSAREKRRKTSVQADSQGHILHYHELMMLCLACQLLFLTGYYFTIYAKENNLPEGRWNTISHGVTQTSLFRVQQRK